MYNTVYPLHAGTTIPYSCATLYLLVVVTTVLAVSEQIINMVLVYFCSSTV
jgi:hypothetical protein